MDNSVAPINDDVHPDTPYYDPPLVAAVYPSVRCSYYFFKSNAKSMEIDNNNVNVIVEH